MKESFSKQLNSNLSNTRSASVKAKDGLADFISSSSHGPSSAEKMFKENLNIIHNKITSASENQTEVNGCIMDISGNTENFHKSAKKIFSDLKEIQKAAVLSNSKVSPVQTTYSSYNQKLSKPNKRTMNKSVDLSKQKAAITMNSSNYNNDSFFEKKVSKSRGRRVTEDDSSKRMSHSFSKHGKKATKPSSLKKKADLEKNVEFFILLDKTKSYFECMKKLQAATDNSDDEVSEIQDEFEKLKDSLYDFIFKNNWEKGDFTYKETKKSDKSEMKMKKQLEEKSTKISALEEDNEQLENQVKELNDKLEEFESINEQLSKEIETIQAKYELALEEKDNLHEEINLKSKEDSEDDKFEEYEEMVEKFQEELNKKNEIIKTKETELQAKESELFALKNKASEGEVSTKEALRNKSELNRLKSELAVKIKDIEMKAESAKQMKQKHVKLIKEMGELKIQFSNLEQESSSEKIRLKAEKSELQEKLRKLKEEQDGAEQEELESLEEELKLLRKEKEELVYENQLVTQNYENLKEEFAEFQSKTPTEDKDETINQLTSKVTSLTSQMREALSKVTSANADKLKLQRENDNLANEKNKLLLEKTELTDKLAVINESVRAGPDSEELRERLASQRVKLEADFKKKLEKKLEEHENELKSVNTNSKRSNKLIPINTNENDRMKELEEDNKFYNELVSALLSFSLEFLAISLKSSCRDPSKAQELHDDFQQLINGFENSGLSDDIDRLLYTRLEKFEEFYALPVMGGGPSNNSEILELVNTIKANISEQFEVKFSEVDSPSDLKEVVEAFEKDMKEIIEAFNGTIEEKQKVYCLIEEYLFNKGFEIDEELEIIDNLQNGFKFIDEKIVDNKENTQSVNISKSYQDIDEKYTSIIVQKEKEIAELKKLNAEFCDLKSRNEEQTKKQEETGVTVNRLEAKIQELNQQLEIKEIELDKLRADDDSSLGAPDEEKTVKNMLELISAMYEENYPNISEKVEEIKTSEMDPVELVTCINKEIIKTLDNLSEEKDENNNDKNSALIRAENKLKTLSEEFKEVQEVYEKCSELLINEIESTCPQILDEYQDQDVDYDVFDLLKKYFATSGKGKKVFDPENYSVIGLKKLQGYCWYLLLPLNLETEDVDPVDLIWVREDEIKVEDFKMDLQDDETVSGNHSTLVRKDETEKALQELAVKLEVKEEQIQKLFDEKEALLAQPTSNSKVSQQAYNIIQQELEQERDRCVELNNILDKYKKENENLQKFYDSKNEKMNIYQDKNKSAIHPAPKSGLGLLNQAMQEENNDDDLELLNEQMGQLKDEIKKLTGENQELVKKLEELADDGQYTSDERYTTIKRAFEVVIPQIPVNSKTKESLILILRLLDYTTEEIEDLMQSDSKKRGFFNKLFS